MKYTIAQLRQMMAETEAREKAEQAEFREYLEEKYGYDVKVRDHYNGEKYLYWKFRINRQTEHFVVTWGKGGIQINLSDGFSIYDIDFFEGCKELDQILMDMERTLGEYLAKHEND